MDPLRTHARSLRLIACCIPQNESQRRTYIFLWRTNDYIPVYIFSPQKSYSLRGWHSTEYLCWKRRSRSSKFRESLLVTLLWTGNRQKESTARDQQDDKKGHRRHESAVFEFPIGRISSSCKRIQKITTMDQTRSERQPTIDFPLASCMDVKVGRVLLVSYLSFFSQESFSYLYQQELSVK